jgi:hypothetical protein
MKGKRGRCGAGARPGPTRVRLSSSPAPSDWRPCGPQDHFIFRVEGTGVLPVREVVRQVRPGGRGGAAGGVGCGRSSAGCVVGAAGDVCAAAAPGAVDMGHSLASPASPALRPAPHRGPPGHRHPRAPLCGPTPRAHGEGEREGGRRARPAGGRGGRWARCPARLELACRGDAGPGAATPHGRAGPCVCGHPQSPPPRLARRRPWRRPTRGSRAPRRRPSPPRPRRRRTALRPPTRQRGRPRRTSAAQGGTLTGQGRTAERQGRTVAGQAATQGKAATPGAATRGSRAAGAARRTRGLGGRGDVRASCCEWCSFRMRQL